MFKDEIKAIADSSTKGCWKTVKKNFPKEYESIQNMPGNSFSEKLYLWLNPNTSIICDSCHTANKKFISYHVGYSKSCSSKCSADLRVKRGDCSLTKPENRQKARDNLSGVDWNVRNKKSQLTSMKKYGVNHPMQSQEVKDTLSNSFKKKYGDHPMKTDLIKNKIKNTNLEKYGFENPFHNTDYIRECFEQKYQARHPMQVEQFRSKRSTTHKERHGVEWPQQIYYNKENLKTRIIDKTYSNYFNNDMFEIITPKNEYKGFGQYYQWRCRACNFVSTKRFHNLSCDNCLKGFRSKLEKEIWDFLQDLNIEVLVNRRTLLDGLEIDLFCPKENLGIEICGLYWHSSLFKKQNDHLIKLQKANNSNITLLTIFEDEWLHKKEIVKERIRYKLKLSPRVTSARKCLIKKTDISTVRDFLDKNHLQGSHNSGIYYAAYYKDDIVAVMTFSKLRRVLGRKSSHNSWEMTRFSSKGSIPGIGGKLLARFIKDTNPEKIISYSDLRWGEGELYKKLGFSKIRHSKPNYFYMNDFKSRLHRYNFRKDILVKEGYDPSLTEAQIMEYRGFHKIWDCGTSVWEWSR